ncbi:hypothetical protein GOBAR_AA09773 [Gossypium barbadense]|uniref:Uncharacterized protein n=1 Tax=Gossypium barbadense TaxID=3634 RepID=A0A2P5Y5N6_GOSBA|nr:hypothetical protein GOBAR_AA09773 [Gossypium barbadense]
MQQVISVPPLLEQEPPAPWALGRARALGTNNTLVLGWTVASSTIGNLRHQWCGSIGILLLGHAGALDAIGNLGRQWCESFEHHRHLDALDVREL